MFLIIAVILLALWGLGLAIRIVGGIIHIVLVLALVMFALHFFGERGDTSGLIIKWKSLVENIDSIELQRRAS